MQRKMFNKLKLAVNNAISGVPPFSNGVNGETDDDSDDRDSRSIKFPYSRPDFLHLTPDEVQVSADHTIRPILVPRDTSKIPWQAGYAEVINGGKSKWNEDQARAGTFFVRGVDKNQNPVLRASSPSTSTHSSGAENEFAELSHDPLPFTYFAVFDGHAGTGAAIMAAHMLHNFIQERLNDVRNQLITKRYALDESHEGADSSSSNLIGYQFKPRTVSRRMTADELVIGALESAFIDMDAVIKEESANYKITGGCTAIAALFFLGKLYVANAGDSRAILVDRGQVKEMSNDFTPESERERVQYLAKLQPELLYGEFTRLQFSRRVTRRDIGKQVLYRDAHMQGWAYKVVEESDCKIPLVFGEGKRARVLATIGVTRGFGDHDLSVLDTGIRIKPFLTPAPEVLTLDLLKHDFGENDVLIMATDGLWDVIPNQKAMEIVTKSLSQLEPDDPLRYTSAAQDLIVAARGLLKKGWKTVDDLTASYDDISCFVIPLSKYGGTLTKSSSTESSIGNTSIDVANFLTPHSDVHDTVALHDDSLVIVDENPGDEENNVLLTGWTKVNDDSSVNNTELKPENQSETSVNEETSLTALSDGAGRGDSENIENQNVQNIENQNVEEKT